MEGDKVAVELICYNWMPTIADHVLDLPEAFYTQAGTSRLHNAATLDPYSVKDGDLVFVKTDFIVDGTFEKIFLDKIFNRFNLITGVSSFHIGRDGGDIYRKILEHPFLNKWICTNPPNINSDKIIPIPIGFEEPDRPGGNQEFLQRIKENRTPFAEKLEKVFLPYHNFSTNSERKSLYDFLKGLPFVVAQEEKQELEEYFQTMDKYKFIIGIEGSGPDIHRNYEAMLVGSIPIGIKNAVEGIFKFHNASAVFLSSWKELDDKKFQDLLENKFDIDANDEFLKLENHISLIKDLT